MRILHKEKSGKTLRIKSRRTEGKFLKESMNIFQNETLRILNDIAVIY